MPNFIYPRKITITRAAFGSTAQDGLNQTEVTIMENVDASIQLKRNRSSTAIAYPGATNADDSMPTWKMYFKGPSGLVQKGDKVVDDNGEAYIVEAPYWNSLGYSLEARYYVP